MDILYHQPDRDDGSKVFVVMTST